MVVFPHRCLIIKFGDTTGMGFDGSVEH